MIDNPKILKELSATGVQGSVEVCSILHFKEHFDHENAPIFAVFSSAYTHTQILKELSATKNRGGTCTGL